MDDTSGKTMMASAEKTIPKKERRYKAEDNIMVPAGKFRQAQRPCCQADQGFSLDAMAGTPSTLIPMQD